MVCTTEGSAEGWNGVTDVGALGVRVTGRPVREELVENALEEELAELEELDEKSVPFLFRGPGVMFQMVRVWCETLRCEIAMYDKTKWKRALATIKLGYNRCRVVN